MEPRATAVQGREEIADDGRGRGAGLEPVEGGGAKNKCTHASADQPDRWMARGSLRRPPERLRANRPTHNAPQQNQYADAVQGPLAGRRTVVFAACKRRLRTRVGSATNRGR
jgi:hypothetical protein